MSADALPLAGAVLLTKSCKTLPPVQLVTHEAVSLENDLVEAIRPEGILNVKP